MKLKSLFLLATLSGVAMVAFGQNADDALRYSNYVPSGTAKFVSMGGALGAIGADFSADLVNPAGIGVFRKDQMSISTSWHSSNVNARYYGTSSNTSTKSFAVDNFGIASAFEIGSQGCKFLNFGFAYSKLASFDRDVKIVGDNGDHSMLDYEVDCFNDYIDRKNLFYKADLFFLNPEGDRYINDYEESGRYGANQTKRIKSDGYMNEYAFTLGANFNDALYIGGSVNITHVDYSQNTTYTEVPFDDSVISLDRFSTYDEFKTSGNAVNVKFGAIYWLTENVRLGAAIHSPIFFSMYDDYYDEVESHIWYNEDGDDYIQKNIQNVEGDYDWELNIPAKFIGSAAFVFGGVGMIDVDCEVLNYSSLSLDDRSGSGDDFDDVNDAISDMYRTAVNLRAGGELLLGPMALRCGFGYYSSPYKSKYENSDANTLVYSFGVGLHSGIAYFDLGYSNSTKNETYYLYGYDDSASSLKNKNGNLTVTFGLKF